MATQKPGTEAGRFSIDPSYELVDIYDEDNTLTMHIWRDKYRYGDEEHPLNSMQRVVEGVYAKDPNKNAKRDALDAMQRGLWLPAGRIQAGAGTPNIVTMLNCYMSQDIEDSMTGIMDSLKHAALTQQQGGGIGMNFSTLRPSGAYLRRTGAVASGPLPFMDMWDGMCATIMSAGSRRGAMMAVMADDHPDLVDFITAKHEKGRLTNFNVSVLVSDAFLAAVADDEEWILGSNTPRADGRHVFQVDREMEGTGQPEMWYAYERWNARELWNLILENTYEWSEPGVIFIDRVNRWNNLRYCESITGTNPCGEQPLPANGCCNLGAINLSRCIKHPFTERASVDLELIQRVAAVGTRFLDNVIDVTLYPLEAQAKEEFAKRRIGIGITGLANALSMLQQPYGSPAALATTDRIMETITDAVYLESSHLAAERGSFPLYDKERWAQTSPVYPLLSDDVRTDIRTNGIRNGVLMTIAPTGTTSLYAGNISSGLEPVFLHKVQRQVRQPDGKTFKPYTAYDYGYKLYCALKSIDPDRSVEMPDYMVTHASLGVEDHINMQAACQKWIDASVSKTINCPKDITFEAFKDLYDRAYELGCKGCTSYRPSDVRGSILSSTETEAAKDARTSQPLKLVRPEILVGSTYKVQWPSSSSAYYITINDVGGVPFELFIHSTSSKYADWTTALGLMISAIMRQGTDISFIPDELMKVQSAVDSGHVGSKFYGSLVAVIGHTIGKHLKNSVDSAIESDPKGPHSDSHIQITGPIIMEECPSCGQPAIIKQEGCESCTNCTYTKC